MKCYYHTPDGELHGPADLDFLIREVRYSGLPFDLMVRKVQSEDWVWIGDLPGAPQEWKPFKERRAEIQDWRKAGGMPEYGLSSCFQWLFSLFSLSGRSSRNKAAAAYWLMVGFGPLVWAACFVGVPWWLETLPFSYLFTVLVDAGILFFYLFGFIALGFRRVHDAGLSGGVLMAVWPAWIAALFYFLGRWQAWFIFEIPFLGILMLAAFMTAPVLFSLLLPEQRRGNRYGEPILKR